MSVGVNDYAWGIRRKKRDQRGGAAREITSFQVQGNF